MLKLPVNWNMNWHFNVFDNFNWIRFLNFDWVWFWDMAGEENYIVENLNLTFKI